MESGFKTGKSHIWRELTQNMKDKWKRRNWRNTCVPPSHAQSGQGVRGVWQRICATLGRPAGHRGRDRGNSSQPLAKLLTQICSEVEKVQARRCPARHCSFTIFTQAGTTMSSKPAPHCQLMTASLSMWPGLLWFFAALDYNQNFLEEACKIKKIKLVKIEKG